EASIEIPADRDRNDDAVNRLAKHIGRRSVLPFRHEHFDKDWLYLLSVEFDLKSPLQEHREVLGDGLPHLLHECVVLEVSRNALIKFPDENRGARLGELLARYGRFV